MGRKSQSSCQQSSVSGTVQLCYLFLFNLGKLYFVFILSLFQLYFFIYSVDVLVCFVSRFIINSFYLLCFYFIFLLTLWFHVSHFWSFSPVYCKQTEDVSDDGVVFLLSLVS